MKDKKLHVIMGTGPVGLAVMDHLLGEGAAVRMVNRSGQADVPPEVTVIAEDVSNPEAAIRACEGAAVVYHCAAPPYSKWADLFPSLTRSILAGAKSANARLVFADNLYAYGPAPQPMHEDLPLQDVGPLTGTRKAMQEMLMAAHEAGDLEVVIIKASDFYGPRVTGSHMGDRVFPGLLSGKSVSMIGDPDQPHSFTFIRDFARAMVMAGQASAAAGEVYHVPEAETLTPREFIQRAADLADKETRVRGMGRGMMRFLGLFVPILRTLQEVLYQFETPFIVDSRKFEADFGDIATPLDEALEETLDWYRDVYQKD
jgi:nucleoside-diphosphate-sugar epimerase